MSVGIEDGSLDLDLWTEVAPEKHAFLGVEASNELYAFPLGSVREILMKPKISEVPRAPDTVLGVISVRGDVTTVVQLRRLLRLAGDDTAAPERVLLVDNGEELIGVGVDSVIRVFWVAPTEIEYSSNMTANLSDFVVGIVRVSGRVRDTQDILILVDPMTLLANP